jgi:hypothetical protein
LFLKQKAVAAEIQETVVVVDQVYWISHSKQPRKWRKRWFGGGSSGGGFGGGGGVLWWIWRRLLLEVARVEVGKRLCNIYHEKKLQFAAFYDYSLYY